MHLEVLMNPLVAYGLAAMGLVVSLVLFVNIRWEIAKSHNQALDREEEWQVAREADRQTVRALESELENLRESVRHLEHIPSAGRGGMSINLVKRAQALRMYRRGEPLTSIAAALEAPSNEIALLLKLHALTNDGNGKVS